MAFGKMTIAAAVLALTSSGAFAQTINTTTTIAPPPPPAAPLFGALGATTGLAIGVVVVGALAVIGSSTSSTAASTGGTGS